MRLSELFQLSIVFLACMVLVACLYGAAYVLVKEGYESGYRAAKRECAECVRVEESK